MTDEQHSVRADTSYIVFALAEGGDYWEQIGDSKVWARDANAAIKTAVSKLSESEQEGTFVAVPYRSWNPVKVVPQVVTTLSLEQVKS